MIASRCTEEVNDAVGLDVNVYEGDVHGSLHCRVCWPWMFPNDAHERRPNQVRYERQAAAPTRSQESPKAQ
jgi:hypothetical protein